MDTSSVEQVSGSPKKYRKTDLDRENCDEIDETGKSESQNPLLSIYNYLVVLSVILIIFAAFRNSVTWWVDNNFIAT